jgi:UDP-glucuronate 4-epimerase
MKNVLVTGSAGFIGFHYSKFLIDNNFKVIGIDNINNYYTQKIKYDRLKILKKFKNFKFFKVDILNHKKLDRLVRKFKIEIIIHLAAQAGVRFSITNPKSYISNNIDGFLNILEISKKNKIKHLVYASSSSIYGMNKKIPFKENHSASHPTSIYAASKRSNELMAHVYSNLYDLPTTGLRFFTVYGPWGRPDMSLFKFVHLNSQNKKIDLYNYGKHTRDFTYVDDVVDIVFRLMKKIPKRSISKKQSEFESPAPWRIYNVSSSKPKKLKLFIQEIEKQLNQRFRYNKLPLQKGDVEKTSGSMNITVKKIGFKPKRKLEYGIKQFINWYKFYYNK